MTSYKKWWLAPQKPVNGPPMPMQIPKGYKSPFKSAEDDGEGETSLIFLWSGQKKFLRQFHVPKKKKTYLGIEKDSPTIE